MVFYADGKVIVDRPSQLTADEQQAQVLPCALKVQLLPTVVSIFA